MEEWKEYKLGEVVIPVKDRIETSCLDSTSYISTENMLPEKAGITLSSGVPSGNAVLFKKDDVLISNIRPYFKKIWRANRDGGCSADVICLRASNVVDPLFLYYLLSQDLFFDYVMQGAKGTKMPRGDRNQIMQWPVLIPSKNEQHNIASILSALDDKIEINRRINDNLEQQAQALFKSWFVDFEPFKNGEFVESELGMIPKGWRVGKLGEMVTTNKRSYKGGFSRPIQYLDTSSITNNIIDSIQMLNPDVDKIPSRARRTVTEGDIVFSSVRPNQRHYGLLFNPASNFVVSTGFVVITSNWSGYRYFVYRYLTQDVIIGALQAIAEQSVSTFPSINASDIENLKMIIPPDEIIGKYAHLCVEISHQSDVLNNESRRLAELRDALLPKLMSGELKVNEIEK